MAVVAVQCPECGSQEVVKYGRQPNGEQRYRCNYRHCVRRIFRGRMAPSGARPSTGPEKRSAPRAGLRLGGAVASRWRP